MNGICGGVRVYQMAFAFKTYLVNYCQFINFSFYLLVTKMIDDSDLDNIRSLFQNLAVTNSVSFSKYFSILELVLPPLKMTSEYNLAKNFKCKT